MGKRQLFHQKRYAHGAKRPQRGSGSACLGAGGAGMHREWQGPTPRSCPTELQPEPETARGRATGGSPGAGAGQPPWVEHTPSPGSATPLNTPDRNAYTSTPNSKGEHSGQHL